MSLHKEREPSGSELQPNHKFNHDLHSKHLNLTQLQSKQKRIVIQLVTKRRAN